MKLKISPTSILPVLGGDGCSDMILTKPIEELYAEFKRYQIERMIFKVLFQKKNDFTLYDLYPKIIILLSGFLLDINVFESHEKLRILKYYLQFWQLFLMYW